MKKEARVVVHEDELAKIKAMLVRLVALQTPAK